jgi:predicted metal-dependent phosphoesterase TrpH
MTTVFDLHIHTKKYSDCSFIHPEELIAQALDAKLNGIALT